LFPPEGAGVRSLSDAIIVLAPSDGRPRGVEHPDAKQENVHASLRLDMGMERERRPSDGDHFIERSILVPPSLLSPSFISATHKKSVGKENIRKKALRFAGGGTGRPNSGFRHVDDCLRTHETVGRIEKPSHLKLGGSPRKCTNENIDRYSDGLLFGPLDFHNGKLGILCAEFRRIRGDHSCARLFCRRLDNI